MGKLISRVIFLGKIFRFMFGGSGRDYGISAFSKLRLVVRMLSNRKKVTSLTTTSQLITMIEHIFCIPPSWAGDIVECGCFNGASTISLSLASALVHRKLLIFDSFEGLPDPAEDEVFTIRTRNTFYRWKKGEFSPAGGLDMVKENVRKWGNISVCTFIKGFFSETLANIKTEGIVFVFEDVDLPSSVRDCLSCLWPRLHEGCRFYSHEPWSIDVVSLFYDRSFWRDAFDEPPPGFVGAGSSGFIIEHLYDRLGYSEKRDRSKVIERGTRVTLAGSM